MRSSGRCEVHVSAISRVETLGYHRLGANERAWFERFFAAAIVHPLDDAVIDRAIQLRGHRKMGLGDALIAATALVHDLMLVTRNAVDFQWVPDIRLVDPYATGG
jgi:toxin FitB